MAMEYNTSPISLREAKVMLDGLVVADAVKATIKFTPDVWSGKQLGERTPSSRWLGGKITGDITRRRSTPFLKEKVMEYLKSGKTPELTNINWSYPNGGNGVAVSVMFPSKDNAKYTGEVMKTLGSVKFAK